jgi:hypothetical protein
MDERPPVWRVAANILKPTRDGPSSWSLGEVLITLRPRSILLRNIYKETEMITRNISWRVKAASA